MTGVIWTISKAQKDLDFPYRVEITHGKTPLLDLRAKKYWPEGTANVFCIRTKEGDGPFTEVERVPVLSVDRNGAKYTVVLDRPQQKQCEFLSVTKPYKKKNGQYEQIFWRTTDALTANRPRVKMPPHADESHITVTVHEDEKYAWKFPQYTVRKAQLPAGSYALMDGDSMAAVILRKTFAEMIGHFADIVALHEQLRRLEATARPALVIEANYADFLNPRKQKEYAPAHCRQLVAQLQAMHPTVPIVYTGAHKTANEWAHNHFHTIAQLPGQPQPMAEHAPTEDVREEVVPQQTIPHDTIQKEGAPSTLLDRLPDTFTTEAAYKAFPGIPAPMVKKALADLRKQGKVTYTRGKNAIWKRTPTTTGPEDGA